MADFADGAWCPDIALETPRKWRLQIAKFGDGYEQRMLDGINALTRSWKVSYSLRDRATLAAMNDYLTAQQARSFPFADPGLLEEVLVFCDEWSISWSQSRPAAGQAYGTLSAEFREAFGVTA